MTTLKLNVVVGMKATSVITFSDVDFFFAAVVVRNFDVDFGFFFAAVVMRKFDVDLGVSVAALRISVTANNVGVSIISST